MGHIQILTVAKNWGSCCPTIKWSPGQRKISALSSPDLSQITSSRSFNILHLINISYRFALLSRAVYMSSNYNGMHLLIVEMEVNKHQVWVFATCFCHLTLNCSSGCSTAPEKIPSDVAFSSGSSRWWWSGKCFPNLCFTWVILSVHWRIEGTICSVSLVCSTLVKPRDQSQTHWMLTAIKEVILRGNKDSFSPGGSA